MGQLSAVPLSSLVVPSISIDQVNLLNFYRICTWIYLRFCHHYLIYFFFILFDIRSLGYQDQESIILNQLWRQLKCLYFDFGKSVVRCLILWKSPIVTFSIMVSSFNLILCVESASFMGFVVLKDGQAVRTLQENLEGGFTELQ